VGLVSYHVNEQVLRFQIAMQDAVLMAVSDALQQLIQERLRKRTDNATTEEEGEGGEPQDRERFGRGRGGHAL
jgi:hypothetical protein